MLWNIRSLYVIIVYITGLNFGDNCTATGQCAKELVCQADTEGSQQCLCADEVTQYHRGEDICVESKYHC